jgi:hypothetical protein
MGHVVLLGDSVFDNVRYVHGKPPVIEQVRRFLPQGWKASLLAGDGNMVADVVGQLDRLPADATHLFVSAGGNDALGERGVLLEPAATVADALILLHDSQSRFHEEYRKMLKALGALGRPTALCTIYDTIPGYPHVEMMALSLFNEVILREAFAEGLPVIDLRLVFRRADDYSDVSPIEPSMLGGSKIAHLIAEVATKHDFSSPRPAVYA